MSMPLKYALAPVGVFAGGVAVVALLLWYLFSAVGAGITAAATDHEARQRARCAQMFALSRSASDSLGVVRSSSYCTTTPRPEARP